MDGGDSMLKPYIYFIKKSFILNTNITIIKNGNVRPTIVTSVGIYFTPFLFQAHRAGHTLEVDGIRFYKASLILIRKAVTVKLSNCVIENGIKFINAIGYTRQNGSYNIKIFNSK